MKYKEIYSELGKLLYAVADIDGVISKNEKKNLLKIIDDDLVPLDERVDKYGTDLAYYSEIEFDFLDEEISDAKAAFESFIDFVEDHHTAIDQRMANTTLKVVKKLADAYHGTNKKEEKLIQSLSKKLQEIQFRD